MISAHAQEGHDFDTAMQIMVWILKAFCLAFKRTLADRADCSRGMFEQKIFKERK